MSWHHQIRNNGILINVQSILPSVVLSVTKTFRFDKANLHFTMKVFIDHLSPGKTSESVSERLSLSSLFS